MAGNPKKRQKSLERKKAKRKEKKHQLVKAQSVGLAGQLQQASAAPVLECWRGVGLFDSGMGQVMISRQLPNGFVAFGLFLVDMYCLGVKNAFGGVVGPFRYQERFGKHHLPYPVVPMDPAAARKLVEGAVAYAQSLGLPPHADYHKAKMIFGDVDPAQSTEEFTYGKDGKPFFVAGPHDSMARCKQIINTLARNCGEGNYHFVMPIAGGASLVDGAPEPLAIEETDDADYEDYEDEE